MGFAKKIGIIGDGGWGTTLGIVLLNKGCDVTVWGPFPKYIGQIRRKRENIKFLPGVSLPNGINFTAKIVDALEGKDAVVLASPSQYMRSVLALVKKTKTVCPLYISVTKGIESPSLKRVSEVIREILGKTPVAVLSGPTIALEVARGVPTTAVAASETASCAEQAQSLFMTDRFRIYSSDDVKGVELGGSLKNIIAIAAGALDAMDFGTNAKAALLTRGLAEIVRLGVAMGAKRETFYGLSGLGDLTTTCISPLSRNRWLGEQIGRGKKLGEILKETEMVVEGVGTTRSVHELAGKLKIEMPITAAIYQVLYEGKDPDRALHELMTRSRKSEAG